MRVLARGGRGHAARLERVEPPVLLGLHRAHVHLLQGVALNSVRDIAFSKTAPGAEQHFTPRRSPGMVEMRYLLVRARQPPAREPVAHALRDAPDALAARAQRAALPHLRRPVKQIST